MRNEIKSQERQVATMFDSCLGTTERCRVLLRLRPSPADESPISVDGNRVVIRPDFDMGSDNERSFAFDHVFDVETTQEQVFDSILRDSIQPVLSGFNATVLAFGQTGAGKTFTLFGDSSKAEQRGIVPRALDEIFKRISDDRSGGVYVVKASMIEIYKEELKDLLRPCESKLRLRESVFDGVWVEGLSWVFVTTAQAALCVLKEGIVSRAVGATQMNEQSSRSHCIFCLRVEYQKPDGMVQRGTLYFADLAGLERVDRTGAQVTRSLKLVAMTTF